MTQDLPPIIQDWIRQLCHPDTVELVTMYGERRRLDVTLFSDRGKVSKPPTSTIV